MNVLINKGRRRLGIPGRPAIILEAGARVHLTTDQVDAVMENRTVVRWLEAGVLVLSDKAEVDTPEVPIPNTHRPNKPKLSPPRQTDERDVQALPEGVTGEGVETHHLGGGWWQVFVNGFKVTDRNVRKDEAESIAAEYK